MGGVLTCGEKLSVSIDVLSLSEEIHGSVGSAWIVGPAEAMKAASAALKAPKGDRLVIRTNKETAIIFDAKPYVISRVQLPLYNLWQLVVRTQDPRFLTGELEVAMTEFLMSPEFTTPLLPEWIPYIIGRCRAAKLLYECRHFVGQSAFYCILKSEILDQFVSQGIRSGELVIPSSSVTSQREVVRYG